MAAVGPGQGPREVGKPKGSGVDHPEVVVAGTQSAKSVATGLGTKDPESPVLPDDGNFSDDGSGRDTPEEGPKGLLAGLKEAAANLRPVEIARKAIQLVIGDDVSYVPSNYGSGGSSSETEPDTGMSDELLAAIKQAGSDGRDAEAIEAKIQAHKDSKTPTEANLFAEIREKGGWSPGDESIDDQIAASKALKAPQDSKLNLLAELLKKTTKIEADTGAEDRIKAAMAKAEVSKAEEAKAIVPVAPDSSHTDTYDGPDIPAETDVYGVFQKLREHTEARTPEDQAAKALARKQKAAAQKVADEAAKLKSKAVEAEAVNLLTELEANLDLEDIDTQSYNLDIWGSEESPQLDRDAISVIQGLEKSSPQKYRAVLDVLRPKMQEKLNTMNATEAKAMMEELKETAPTLVQTLQDDVVLDRWMTSNGGNLDTLAKLSSDSIGTLEGLKERSENQFDALIKKLAPRVKAHQKTLGEMGSKLLLKRLSSSTALKSLHDKVAPKSSTATTVSRATTRGKTANKTMRETIKGATQTVDQFHDVDDAKSNKRKAKKLVDSGTLTIVIGSKPVRVTADELSKALSGMTPSSLSINTGEKIVEVSADDVKDKFNDLKDTLVEHLLYQIGPDGDLPANFFENVDDAEIGAWTPPVRMELVSFEKGVNALLTTSTMATPKEVAMQLVESGKLTIEIKGESIPVTIETLKEALSGMDPSVLMIETEDSRTRITPRVMRDFLLKESIVGHLMDQIGPDGNLPSNFFDGGHAKGTEALATGLKMELVLNKSEGAYELVTSPTKEVPTEVDVAEDSVIAQSVDATLERITTLKDSDITGADKSMKDASNTYLDIAKGRIKKEAVAELAKFMKAQAIPKTMLSGSENKSESGRELTMADTFLDYVVVQTSRKGGALHINYVAPNFAKEEDLPSRSETILRSNDKQSIQSHFDELKTKVMKAKKKVGKYEEGSKKSKKALNEYTTAFSTFLQFSTAATAKDPNNLEYLSLSLLQGHLDPEVASDSGWTKAADIRSKAEERGAKDSGLSETHSSDGSGSSTDTEVPKFTFEGLGQLGASSSADYEDDLLDRLGIDLGGLNELDGESSDTGVFASELVATVIDIFEGDYVTEEQDIMYDLAKVDPKAAEFQASIVMSLALPDSRGVVPADRKKLASDYIKSLSKDKIPNYYTALKELSTVPSAKISDEQISSRREFLEVVLTQHIQHIELQKGLSVPLPGIIPDPYTQTLTVQGLSGSQTSLNGSLNGSETSSYDGGSESSSLNGDESRSEIFKKSGLSTGSTQSMADQLEGASRVSPTLKLTSGSSKELVNYQKQIKTIISLLQGEMYDDGRQFPDSSVNTVEGLSEWLTWISENNDSIKSEYQVFAEFLIDIVGEESSTDSPVVNLAELHQLLLQAKGAEYTIGVFHNPIISERVKPEDLDAVTTKLKQDSYNALIRHYHDNGLGDKQALELLPHERPLLQVIADNSDPYAETSAFSLRIVDEIKAKLLFLKLTESSKGYVSTEEGVQIVRLSHHLTEAEHTVLREKGIYSELATHHKTKEQATKERMKRAHQAGKVSVSSGIQKADFSEEQELQYFHEVLNKPQESMATSKDKEAAAKQRGLAYNKLRHHFKDKLSSQSPSTFTVAQRAALHDLSSQATTFLGQSPADSALKVELKTQVLFLKVSDANGAYKPTVMERFFLASKSQLLTPADHKRLTDLKVFPPQFTREEREELSKYGLKAPKPGQKLKTTEDAKAERKAKVTKYKAEHQARTEKQERSKRKEYQFKLSILNGMVRTFSSSIDRDCPIKTKKGKAFSTVYLSSVYRDVLNKCREEKYKLEELSPSEVHSRMAVQVSKDAKDGFKSFLKTYSKSHGAGDQFTKQVGGKTARIATLRQGYGESDAAYKVIVDIMAEQAPASRFSSKYSKEGEAFVKTAITESLPERLEIKMSRSSGPSDNGTRAIVEKSPEAGIELANDPRFKKPMTAEDQKRVDAKASVKPKPKRKAPPAPANRSVLPVKPVAPHRKKDGIKSQVGGSEKNPVRPPRKSDDRSVRNVAPHKAGVRDKSTINTSSLSVVGAKKELQSPPQAKKLRQPVSDGDQRGPRRHAPQVPKSKVRSTATSGGRKPNLQTVKHPRPRGKAPGIPVTKKVDQTSEKNARTKARVEAQKAAQTAAKNPILAQAPNPRTVLKPTTVSHFQGQGLQPAPDFDPLAAFGPPPQPPEELGGPVEKQRSENKTEVSPTQPSNSNQVASSLASGQLRMKKPVGPKRKKGGGRDGLRRRQNAQKQKLIDTVQRLQMLIGKSKLDANEISEVKGLIKLYDNATSGGMTSVSKIDFELKEYKTVDELLDAAKLKAEGRSEAPQTGRQAVVDELGKKVKGIASRLDADAKVSDGAGGELGNYREGSPEWREAQANLAKRKADERT